MKPVLETSIVIFWLRRAYAWPISADEVYKNSRTHALMEVLSDRLMVVFRDSLIGGLNGNLTGAMGADNPAMGLRVIIRNSVLLERQSHFYARSKERIAFYLKTSYIGKLLSQAWSESRFYPLKTYGILIIIPVLINTLFNLLSKSEISAVGWLERAVFFCVGLGVLFSNASWQDVKESSLFLNPR